jgi:hypothetical protein
MPLKMFTGERKRIKLGENKSKGQKVLGELRYIKIESQKKYFI